MSKVPLASTSANFTPEEIVSGGAKSGFNDQTVVPGAAAGSCSHALSPSAGGTFGSIRMRSTNPSPFRSARARSLLELVHHPGKELGLSSAKSPPGGRYRSLSSAHGPSVPPWLSDVHQPSPGAEVQGFPSSERHQ